MNCDFGRRQKTEGKKMNDVRGVLEKTLMSKVLRTDY